MDVRKIPANKIKAAKYNPRKDLKPGDPEYEKLKRSIKEFGYVEPIIWNSRTGNIVGGHQRFKVLLALGEKQIDCVVVDLDEQREKALNLALNKIQGEWDSTLLTDLLKELDASGFDMTLTGFSLEETKMYVGDPPVEEDGFDFEGALGNIEIPISVRGQIWQMGKHRLMCGDATSAKDVDQLMKGATARLCVTDPPYNVNYGEKAQMLEQYDKGHRNTSSIQNDNLPDKQFKEFLLASYKTMNSHMVAGAPIYVFHGDTETMNFRTALREAGFYLSQCLIWVKSSLVLGRSDYHWRHEPILYGWKEGEAHIWFGERDKTTVLEDSPIELEKLKKDELLAMLKRILEPTDQDTILYEHKQTISELHPTMKPVKLLAKLISNSSNKGDMVIDFFGESGSTMMAAEQLERPCRMMELEPKYCDVIIQRWQEFTGAEAKLLDE